MSLDNLRATFLDLRLNATLVSQLGQALNDGRGLFLYGPPGNGKTSISELAVESFGEYVWIPHTINIDGELVRLFDPRSHRPVEAAQLENLQYDRRWILVHRPTIVVGGELSMSQLELQVNQATGICEAPVQMRANCGALVVDDFGRQRMPASEILNRLIVPMEKHRDYLNLASGRQVSVPFDLLLVFSTNLEPRDLVDEAFLRRIPYKIEVHGPEEREFVDLFCELAEKAGGTCDVEAIKRLIEHHYRAVHRPLRYCHPRDLLRQVRNFCEFHGRPFAVTRETLEVAVANYFAGL
jgi:SpoVK/Ycf46/Vps4 family AAA+-type ATPase